VLWDFNANFAFTLHRQVDVSVSYVFHKKVQHAIFAANKSTIIDRENDIKLISICFPESWKFLVESSGVQRDLNAKFLHLLSRGRSTFRSRMSFT